MIAKADKGKTIVIIHTWLHQQGLHIFNWKQLPHNPSEPYQKRPDNNPENPATDPKKPYPSNSKHATQACHTHKTGYQQCGCPFL